MPYIVTTETPQKWGEDKIYEISRKAVATLDEAWDQAASEMSRFYYDHHDDLWFSDTEKRLRSENSGNITLPDGTVIEVESVSWADLSKATNPDNPHGRTGIAILKAYNNR